MGCFAGHAARDVASSGAGGTVAPQPYAQYDPYPEERTHTHLKSRELPLIPESGHQDDMQSVSSSRNAASITTIGTPKSMPLSHLDSVANSILRAEVDIQSFDGRSVGVASTIGTMTRVPDEDARSIGPSTTLSLCESRLDSQNYLSDLDKMVQDDRGLNKGSHSLVCM